MNDINALAVELNEKLGSQWLTYRAAEEEIKSALTKVSEEASAQAREKAIRECAEIAKTEEIPPRESAPNLREYDPIILVISVTKATIKSIEGRILNLLPSNQSSGKEK